ncbi:MAG: GSCFA domain-containing protein [Bacteroidaceae bacterium]|nr:GSCFA domain-containing protein [Bacteroidaceae bacterium]
MTDAEFSLMTHVEMPRMARRITTGDAMVFLGSCFAEHIGERLLSYALPVLCNPVGTLYNPASIRALLSAACDPLPDGGPRPLPLFPTAKGTEWRCWLAATGLAAPSRTACETLMNERLDALARSLAQSRYLFVTLGTSVCYRLRESGQTVANCHKMPAALFEEQRLTTAECVEALSDIVRIAQAQNPDVEVLFTVSPYRYQKYGFHGSQLAKATLLLAVDEVCRRHSDCCLYLPVYEIFMDELRDYRYYAADMLHPSEVAIEVVWRRLVAECMSERLQHYLSDYEPIRRGLAHRPLAPDSESYRTFMAELDQKRLDLKSQYGIQDIDRFIH